MNPTFSFGGNNGTAMESSTEEEISLMQTHSILEFTMSSDEDERDWRRMEQPLAIHILFQITLVPLGVTGNAFLIYTYAKRSKLQAGLVFTVAMAIMDLYACVTVIPLLAFMPLFTRMKEEDDNAHGFDFFFRSTFVTITLNLVLLVAMALDRVWAVFLPFSYSTSKKRSLMLIGALILFSFCFVFFFEMLPSESGSNSRIGASTLVLMSFLVLFGSYAAIAVKLRKQRSKVKNVAFKNTAIPRQRISVAVSSSTGKQTTGSASTKITKCKASFEANTSTNNDNLRLNLRSDNSSETVHSKEQNTKKENNVAMVKTKISGADKRVIKIFISLTALFFVSFIPLLLKLLGAIEAMTMFYVYFSNHAANPVIYYVIDTGFRAEANRYLGKLKFW